MGFAFSRGFGRCRSSDRLKRTVGQFLANAFRQGDPLLSAGIDAGVSGAGMGLVGAAAVIFSSFHNAVAFFLVGILSLGGLRHAQSSDGNRAGQKSIDRFFAYQ